MKNVAIFIECACVWLIGLLACGCTDDESSAAAESIGFTNCEVVLSGLDDTIATLSDNWTLERITIDADSPDLSKDFSPNLSAKNPFTYIADWLTITYADRNIILSAQPCYDETSDNKSFYICLRTGDSYAEIHGRCEYYGLLGFSKITATPSEVEISAEGGTAIIDVTDGTWVGQMVIGGQYLYTPVAEGSKTLQWMTVTKLNSTQWQLSAEPNTGAQSRTCKITFQLQNAFAGVLVTQAGI